MLNDSTYRPGAVSPKPTAKERLNILALDGQSNPTRLAPALGWPVAGPRGANPPPANMPSADQGSIPASVGMGDARRQMGDYDRTAAPAAPPAPAASGLGFGPTSISGVYRRGNEFSDAAGVNDTALWNRGQPSAQSQTAAERLSGQPPLTAADAAGIHRPASTPEPASGPMGRTAASSALLGGALPQPAAVGPNAAALQRLQSGQSLPPPQAPADSNMDAAQRLAAAQAGQVPGGVPVASNVAALARLNQQQGTAPGLGFGPTSIQTANAGVPAVGENSQPGLGANIEALARYRAANPDLASTAPGLGFRAGMAREVLGGTTPQPGLGFPPRQFDRAASIRALSDLRSPEAIALRNLRVSAEQEARDGAGLGRAARGMNPAGQAYAALLGELTTGTRQAQSIEAQETGQSARAQLQDFGATQRALLGEQGATARAAMTNDIERGKLALEQQSFGLKSRSARQLEAAQEAFLSARTPQERAQAAQNLRVLSGKGDMPTAPSGYRWTGTGDLQPIPGGPGDKSRDPKLTEDQAKSAGYAVRMENALGLLKDIGKQNPGAARPGVGTALLNTLPEGVANMVRLEDRQRVEAAQLDALDAALTLNTGAAYTREQLQGLHRAYFAQPGDSDQTVAEKQARLSSLIDTARLRAGPHGNQMADTAVQRNQRATQGQQQPGKGPASYMPQTGEVRRGYRFRGGNPSDRNNWEAVQ